MRQAWLVACRDYLETVRSGTFLILLLIVPFLLIVSIAVPRLLERSAKASRFALLDLPPAWVEKLQSACAADEDMSGRIELVVMNTPAGADPQAHRRAVEEQVRREQLYGFVFQETVDGDVTAAVTTRTASSENDARRWLMRNLPSVVRLDRARRMGLTPEQVARLDAPVEIKAYLLGDASGHAKTASATDRLAAFLPMIFTYLLWIVVMTLVQRLLMATVEEKSNRTVEIILSSVSPFTFMAGKLLAGVLEGVTVLVVWLGTLYFAADYFSAQYLHDLDLTILFARRDHLAFLSVYFALGFILYAALTIGLGSLCNSIKETQNMMTPVMMVMMVPLLVMSFVGENPNAPISVVLSYIPFFTPFLMMNRIAATPPPHWLEIVVSTALLLLTIWGTTWAGAKLFRIGILMTGKPPSLRNVVRLLRAPGAVAIGERPV